MAIYYSELHEIGCMTNKELVAAYKQATKKRQRQTKQQLQDIEDRTNAILSEMQDRGMEHP